jgi:DNA-binding NtrC family response regulator
MARYDWPGNSRQLENEIKRLLASVRSRTITEDQLAIQRDREVAAAAAGANPQTAKLLHAALEELERQMIQKALAASGGNKLKAAQSLGLSRQGLFKKLKKFGLPTA